MSFLPYAKASGSDAPIRFRQIGRERGAHMSTYISCMKRCLDFSSKAAKPEYWLFILSSILVGFIEVFLYIAIVADTLRYEQFNIFRFGGLMSAVYLIFLVHGVWSFVAFLAVTARRLNDIQWPLYCLLMFIVPYAGVAAMVVFGLVPGKLSNDQKIFALNRLLNELHQEFMKKGPQSGLVFIPCPDYGQEVAELAALKICDSGKYQASYSGGCFAIKAIKKAA